uniref:GOLD domain-containing protein n=2 Tax=Acrobeloides nanus TaxID=290746 RepID=A0A914BYS7_9BILA
MYTQIKVEPGQTECFWQDLTNEKHVAFEVDYQVTDGGDLDINFYIITPRAIRVVQEFRKSDGQHRVDVKQEGRGDYALCFDNSFSYQTAKNVFFEMFLLDEKGDYLNNYDLFSSSNVKAQELNMHINSFERITTKVKANLNRVEHLQSQLRAQENKDRSIMESNFERVNNWSIIHLCVMLFVVGLQVYTVRSLFEENSKVGRFIRKGKLND